MSGPGVELRHYYRAIARRFWLVLVLVALAAGGTYMRVASQPPKYAAEATLMVTASVIRPPTSALGDGAGSTGGRPAPVANDIIQLVSSRPVAERVARALGLPGPGVVRSSVSATPVRGTSLIRIRAVSTDRELSPRLANTTADQLIEHFREINRRDARDVRLYIEQQLALVRQRLAESDQAIQGYKVRHNIIDIDQARSQAAAQAQAAETERQNALVALRETEARLRAAKAKLTGEKLERVMARTTRDNPVFVQLQQRLTQLELQRVEASQVYTAQHPRMIQLESEIAELRQRMTAEAKTVLSDQTVGANPLHTQFLGQVATLEVERAATNARLEAIAAVQSRRQAGLRTLPSIESGMAMLRRENEILEQTYAMLAQRHQEALIRESEAAFVTAGVQVMETAVVPNVPISSGLPLQTGIAGLIGLFLGVAAAIFLESTDDKIRSPQDAERTLGVPILAEVPDISPPRTAPAGAALVIALILALLVGGSLVAARASREGEGGRPTTHSMLVRLGQGLGHLTTQLSQAVR